MDLVLLESRGPRFTETLNINVVTMLCGGAGKMTDQNNDACCHEASMIAHVGDQSGWSVLCCMTCSLSKS